MGRSMATSLFLPSLHAAACKLKDQGSGIAILRKKIYMKDRLKNRFQASPGGTSPMPMRKILLGADGSEHSKHAARYAVDLAKAFGSKILIVSAYRGHTIVTDDPAHQYTMKEMRRRAKHRQAWYQELLDKNEIPWESHILDGPAAEAIADVAKRRDTDIIIIGSRGRSNLVGMILGSTANALMHIADCPVLAIRLKHRLPSDK
jgi:nucleotide-binding universal stress UspA family protein